MSKRYYFIGIGGISMSSLSVFVKLDNNEVSGSDVYESESLKALKNFGITYNLCHKKENIKNFNPDIVVINCAIHDDNSELKWAKEHNKKIISRAELLGKISKNFKNVIAISGTHGKTTTTALIAEIFVEAKLKPTVHIGGILKKNNSNFLIGNKRFFITEACEYKNSFLSLSPKVGVALNVETDHLDFFKDLTEIEKSFKEFLEKSSIKICQAKNFDLVNLTKKNVEYEFVLFEENTPMFFSAKNIRKNSLGYTFDYCENDKIIMSLSTNFLGRHNIKNALVATAIARKFKIKNQVIKRVIRNFCGVKRRFEKIATYATTTIIHDYAHHPTEIKKVILQAKDYGKVLTVFQPHTYSRTQKLFPEFLTAFDKSDKTIIVKTYPAREQESDGTTAKELCNVLCTKQPDVFEYADNFKITKNKILKELKNFDCVLILGAGDIDKLARNFA